MAKGVSLERFVRDRIAEDIARADALPCDGAGWFADEIIGAYHGRPGEDEWIVDSNPSLICGSPVSRDVAKWVERWDPLKVRRESETKLRIIERLSALAAADGRGDVYTEADAALVDTLRDMAWSWREHPECDQRWLHD